MPTYKYPGVYIEELPATGPIAGVGTSTTAFIGPALSGPINVPTKITNWTQFKDEFGEYILAPRHYMAYAVRGYFGNGATVAYIVRVGTASRASRELDDRSTTTPAGQALRVEAKREGPAGGNIRVTVQDAQRVPPAAGVRIYKDRALLASGSNNVIKLQNATDSAKFRPGDEITIEGTAERATIDRIRNEELILLTNLIAAPTAGQWVRIADVRVNQKTFRLSKTTGLESGSVIRLSQGTGTPEDRVIDRVAADFVTLAGTGITAAAGYSLAQTSADVAIQSFEFNLIIGDPTASPVINEPFTEMSMDPRHSRYFARIVSSQIVNVTLPATPSVQVPPLNRPALLAATALNPGTADNLAGIGLNNYVSALAALEKVPDVNLICVPDRTDQSAQQAVISHCEKLGDRFGVLDAAPNLPPFGLGSVLNQRSALDSARGYAALYYPWIRINDPASATGEDLILIPPSGHIAGIYASSDERRGIHKAPANEFIGGAVGVERVLDDIEQGEVNVEGVNVIRVFPGRGRPTVWGARTTTPKDEVPWRYINVRRLFNFVETSIKLGIRWAVFEPNDLTLWKKLDRTLTDFLTRVWRSGALFGATAKEAFYVKIDEELNPASVRALGQIVIEIGMAPVRPAEFVIVRIGMWEGGAEISER
jgi:hypothetical protein